MADIRIKDLTTTASSTASDDFIAVDGTTNGTRKLSAFSPTFGGNATVTGTLTTNGGVIIPAAGSISTLTSTNATHVANATWGALSQGYGTTADWSVFNKSQGTVMYVPTGTSNLFLYGKLDANTLSVYSTTASTSTSTGALVVGNGTSGGLGVGGNAYIGGDLVVASHTKGIYSQGYVAVKGYQANLFSRGAPAGWTAGLHFYTNGNDYSATILHYPDNGDLQFFINATSSNYAASDEALRITTAKQVQVKASTASTSTSSGALVVSGGVGVAGAIYAGGILKTTVADAAYNARFFGATGGMRVRGYTDATYGTVVDSLNTAESAYQPLTIAASDLRLNDLTNGTIVTGTGTFTIGGAVVANASSNAFRISNSQTPASAAATGTAGTIAWDSSYIYVCTATNTWKRVAIATW